jgi:hypothetical protein
MDVFDYWPQALAGLIVLAALVGFIAVRAWWEERGT